MTAMANVTKKRVIGYIVGLQQTGNSPLLASQPHPENHRIMSPCSLWTVSKPSVFALCLSPLPHLQGGKHNGHKKR